MLREAEDVMRGFLCSAADNRHPSAGVPIVDDDIDEK